MVFGALALQFYTRRVKPGQGLLYVPVKGLKDTISDPILVDLKLFHTLTPAGNLCVACTNTHVLSRLFLRHKKGFEFNW